MICGTQLNELFPNILVLSAGGWGHVPIPLIKQEETTAAHLKPRAYLVSYVGSNVNAPLAMRARMIEEINETAMKVPRHHS